MVPPTALRMTSLHEADSNCMIGLSAPMRELRREMEKAAASTCTVLITGETGTGKELAAEFIHKRSLRRNKPFVCINCAAIPDSLFESELFGHAKGAFTGADGPHEGLLTAADGGTIFFDEIGDMSLFAQAKVLRVIEQREVRRLGGVRQRQLDIRFLAATSQDLEAMLNRHSFRKDLFYRLDVVRIDLPPLRDRRADIPLLVDHYLRQFSSRSGCSMPGFSDECLQCLSRYEWPGNIRELKNILENLLLGPVPEQIRAEHLPERFRFLKEQPGDLSKSERDLLLSALVSARWNKSEAAEKLHWSRMTLYRKIAKYGISKGATESIPSGADRA
jgi:DNA-binding NtrC family response regulator